jgi:hypothetical protein
MKSFKKNEFLVIGDKKYRFDEEYKGIKLYKLFQGFYQKNNALIYKDENQYFLDTAPEKIIKAMYKEQIQAEYKTLKINFPKEIKTKEDKEKYIFYNKYNEILENITYLQPNQSCQYSLKDRINLKYNIAKTIEKLENKNKDIKSKKEDKDQKTLIKTEKATMNENSLNTFKKIATGLTRQNLYASYADYVKEKQDTYYTIFFTQTLEPKYYINLNGDIEKQLKIQQNYLQNFMKNIKNQYELKEIYTYELTKSLNLHKHSLLIIPKDIFKKVYKSLIEKHLSTKETGTIELNILFEDDYINIRKEIKELKNRLIYIQNSKIFKIRESQRDKSFVYLKTENINKKDDIKNVISYIVKYIEKTDNLEILFKKEVKDNVFLELNDTNFLNAKKILEKLYTNNFHKRDRETLDNFMDEDAYRILYFEEDKLQAIPLEHKQIDEPLKPRNKKVINLYNYRNQNKAFNEVIAKFIKLKIPDNNYYFENSIYHINRLIEEGNLTLKKDHLIFLEELFYYQKRESKIFNSKEERDAEKTIIDYGLDKIEDETIKKQRLEYLHFMKTYKDTEDHKLNQQEEALIWEKLRKKQIIEEIKL